VLFYKLKKSLAALIFGMDNFLNMYYALVKVSSNLLT